MHCAIQKRTQQQTLLWLLLLAALVRLIPAVLYENRFDLGSYMIPWAVEGAKDLFGLYGRQLGISYLDYPPLMPTLLSLLGRPIAAAGAAGWVGVEMLLVKLLGILGDLGIVALLWTVGQKNNRSATSWAALFWALNPATIFNCAFWGQVDSVLLLCILGMLWGLEQEKGLSATLWFTVGCLCKLQMAYFAPIFLIGLFGGCSALPMKKKIGLLGVGAAVGIGCWLPFMLRGEGFALPLRIYLGGLGKYSMIHVNAANLYGIANLNMVEDSALLWGGISFAQLSQLVLIGCSLLLGIYAVCYRRLSSKLPLAAAAMVWMNFIFLFTTRMHERYQLPVFALSVLCCLLYGRRYAALAIGLAMTTFVNQFIVLMSENAGGVFRTMLPTVLRITAVGNLALCLVMLWAVCFPLWQSRVRHRLTT